MAQDETTTTPSSSSSSGGRDKVGEKTKLRQKMFFCSSFFLSSFFRSFSSALPFVCCSRFHRVSILPFDGRCIVALFCLRFFIFLFSLHIFKCTVAFFASCFCSSVLMQLMLLRCLVFEIGADIVRWSLPPASERERATEREENRSIEHCMLCTVSLRTHFATF